MAGPFSLGSSRRLTLQWGLRAAARVSFTVETTVLPSFALPRGSCKWEGFVLAKHIFQPRIDRIFTNGKRLRWRFSLLVLFVFIRDIRGSGTSEQVEAEGVVWLSMGWQTVLRRFFANRGEEESACAQASCSERSGVRGGRAIRETSITLGETPFFARRV